jgi:hypothetical protein
MEVCGQAFTPRVLERIGEVLNEEPALSRSALSRRVTAHRSSLDKAP